IAQRHRLTAEKRRIAATYDVLLANIAGDRTAAELPGAVNGYLMYAIVINSVSGRTRDELFFFSSRRRHTRSDRDWSSDVCSSDLEPGIERDRAQQRVELRALARGRFHPRARCRIEGEEEHRPAAGARDVGQVRVVGLGGRARALRENLDDAAVELAEGAAERDALVVGGQPRRHGLALRAGVGRRVGRAPAPGAGVQRR